MYNLPNVSFCYCVFSVFACYIGQSRSEDLGGGRLIDRSISMQCQLEAASGLPLWLVGRSAASEQPLLSTQLSCGVCSAIRRAGHSGATLRSTLATR